MKQQKYHVINLRLCAVLILSVWMSVCCADETESQIKEKVKDVTEAVFYSQDELGEKIKDLLDKRKEQLEIPDFESDFEDLFKNLESLAVRMPSDFTFNVAQFGPKEGHPTFQNQRAMKCFGDKSQFSHFLSRVHEILRELRDDSSENKMDSADSDNDMSKQNDTSADLDRDDSSNNDTSDEIDTKKQTSKTGDSDDVMHRRRRDAKVAGFELDDLFDKLEDDDIECLSGFVSQSHEKFLCRHFTHRSAGIFAKILAAGTKCEDYLDDDDDDDEDDVSLEINVDDILNDKSFEDMHDDLSLKTKDDKSLEVLGSTKDEDKSDDKDKSDDTDKQEDSDKKNEESENKTDEIDDSSEIFEELREIIHEVTGADDSTSQELDDIFEDFKQTGTDSKSHDTDEDSSKQIKDDNGDTDSKTHDVDSEVVKDSNQQKDDDIDSKSRDLEDILDGLTGKTHDSDEQNSKEDDDDDDNFQRGFLRNRLGESYQISILNQMRAAKGANKWTENDVKKILRLAPDVIDDDFFEDLPQNLFNQYMSHFGQMALRNNGNSRLRYILREKLDDDFSKLTPERLRQIGAGLRSLSFSQIQTLDGKLLLETKVKIFDDDDDDDEDDDDSKSKETNVHKKVKIDDDDDDDDDDEDDDVRHALGYRMKEALKHQQITRAQIGRAMKFLHDDLDFVKRIEPDDLYEALEDIRDVDYDDDDARAVFFHLSQSSRFPQIAQLTGQNLTGMGHLLKGMGLAEISMLNKKAIEDALDDIKDIDFDDSQAQGLLEDILDDDEVENLGTRDLKKFGKLLKGMPTGQLQKLKSEVVEDLLDDLDDIDLSDAQKRIIVGMARHNEKFSAKFLGLNKFSSVISVADLDDIDDDDVKLHINVSSRIAWRLPQAVVLARAYKQTLTGQLKAADLSVMGHVAKGLLLDDLDDVLKTDDDFLDVADSLKDIHEDLTSGQIDELAERFEELTDLMNKEVEIDDLKAIRGAHIFAYLHAEQFSKLIFTQTGKAAFISQLAKMSTQKMSREHIQYLATLMLKMIDEIDADDSKDVSEINRDIQESRRLRSLGHMVLGLSADQIKKFSAHSIVDNLAILRNLPLTKDQASAILDKLDDVDKKWHCRPDMMARLGSLLLHDNNPLSDECDWDEQKGLLGSFGAVMKGLEKRNEIIKERLEEGFSREEFDTDDDDDGKKRLVSAMLLLATQNTKPNVRRRRAVIEGVTCDVVMRLKSSVNQVDQHVITSMKDDQFTNCLSTIGAISHWPKETLDALVTKTKLVFTNDVASWSNEVIRRAGSIIAGLTPSEIQVLQLTGVDAMNSVGKHGRLNNEQLKAGFQRWLTLTGKPSVAHVSPSEFSALSEFVCGLEVMDISKINATSFKLSLDVIGQSTSCTQQQREAYLNKAIEVYGSNVSQWDDAVVGDLGHLIGGLSGENLKLLTTRQLALIAPKVIQTLPSDRVSALSVVQLTSLSTNQANAVTEVQYQALTAEQKKILDAKVSVNFNKESTTQTTDNTKGGNNAVSPLTCSIFLMISTLISFLL